MALELETKERLQQRYLVSRHTVEMWMKAGMPTRRIGRLVRFNPIAVDRWIIEWEQSEREHRTEQQRLQQLTGGLHVVRKESA